MRGPAQNNIDFVNLSNIDVALLSLLEIAKANPGLTWGQLASGNIQTMGKKCSGFWDCSKSFGSTTKSTIGDVAGSAGKGIKATVNFIADKGGDLVRLAADDDVSSAIKSAVTSYMTGGASTVGESIFGSGNGDEGETFLDSLGKYIKGIFGGSGTDSAGMGDKPFPNWVMPAIGGVTLLVLLTRKK